MPKKKAKKEKAASSSSSSQGNNDARKASANNASLELKNLLFTASHLSKTNSSNSFVVDEILSGCVWVVPDFLEAKECQAWIDFVEGNHKTTKLEYVQHPATKYVANRECFRWQQDDPNVAKILFDRMEQCGILKELRAKVDFASSSYVPCACNPNIRLYKYEKGMAFGKHVDGSHPVEGMGMTEVTVLVYLSDCQGGSTRFYPATSGKKAKSIAFAPQRGALLVHIHGDRCLEHEADPVISGLKYILRTDIVYSE